MPWILVTGAAQGLGASIAEALLRAGYSVVIHYRKSEKEAEHILKNGGKIAKIQGDFSSLESVNDFIRRYRKQFPDTQGIVNNVGNYLIASASQTTEEQWLSLFQTNLHAPFFLMRALLPSLRKHRGNIVNIGTVGLNTLKANTYSTAYTISKSALWLLTKALAKELAADEVRVNMVSPGILENAIDIKDFPHLPMKRSATLKEVADIVTFLFDPKTSYITGQNIEIAGGFGL